MPRKYTKIKELEPEVFRMKAEGKTNREIAEHFGLTREQIRDLVKRVTTEMNGMSSKEIRQRQRGAHASAR